MEDLRNPQHPEPIAANEQPRPLIDLLTEDILNRHADTEFVPGRFEGELYSYTIDDAAREALEEREEPQVDLFNNFRQVTGVEVDEIDLFGAGFTPSTWDELFLEASALMLTTYLYTQKPELKKEDSRRMNAY